MAHILTGEMKIMSPATWKNNIGEEGTNYSFEVVLGMADKVRVFNGQPDPSDASHFTIGYEVDGQPGTIDGWLTDDGIVKLEVRDGPAKPFN